MKILSIEFENLNSLVGRTKIDFTDAIFSENGIFAIVGPTGSGKTTILDAICLALYGRTPRLKKISVSENEIMSRQTGSCFAEVVFETNQFGRFLCRWNQRRARNQAGGNLQNPTHEISRFDEEKKEWGNPLETRLSLVPGIVEEKTGMDFDRFTRSMMLAQGEFARFLQSNDDERSQLLEQITGTEIYGKISETVFERAKEEKEKRDRIAIELENVEVLSEENRLSFQNEIQELENKDKPQKEEWDRVHAALQRIERIDEIAQKIEQYRKEWERHEISCKDFEPEKIKLDAAQRAGKIEPVYEKFSSLNLQQDGLKENLESSRKQYLEAEKNFLDIQAEEKSAGENLKIIEERHQNELAIIETVQALDVQIDIVSKQIIQEEIPIKEIETEIEKLDGDIKKWEAELARFFPNSSLPETESILKTQTVILNELFGGRKLSDFFSEQAVNKSNKNLWLSLDQILESNEKDKAIRDDLNSKYKESEETLERLRKERKQKEIELGHVIENVKNLDIQLKLLQRINSLEEQRRQLEDGKPCPLCGATEHPFAKENIPTPDAVTEEYQQKDEEQKRLESKIQKIELNQVKIFAEMDRIQDRIDHTNLALSEKEKELTNLMISLKLDRLPEKEQIQTEVEETEKRIQNLQKTINQIEQIESETEKLKTAIKQARETAATIEKLRPLLAAQQAERERRKTGLDLCLRKKEELVDQRLRLFGDKKTTESKQLLQEESRKAKETLEEANRKRILHETEKARIQERWKTLEESLEANRQQLESLQAELLASCRENDFSDVEDFVLARLNPLLLNNLRNEEEKLRQRDRELKTLLKKYEDDLATEQSRQTDEEKSSERNDFVQKKEKIEIERKEVLEKIGSFKLRLQNDEEASDKKGETAKRLELQEKKYSIWKQLNHLIGSADGKKFRTFAQGMTFRIMLEYANRQLEKMSNRYLLVQDDVSNKPLELKVMDLHQAGEIRSIKNLSGGESFLISLALALGLSSMSSRKVRVDSLFLDEGFGTLDEQSLDIALTVLEGLRQEESKQIGIISHVSTIRERIPVQIKVRREKEGRSSVKIFADG